MNDKIITTDNSIKKSEDYMAVERSVNRVIESGVIHISAGYCVSASDMMYISLLHQGIKSHLVECQLTVTYHNQYPEKVVYIGFDSADKAAEGTVNTHVVCVTDTNPPMLIDTSISYVLPFGKLAVIAGLSDSENRIISTSVTDVVGLTYQSKVIQTIPIAHQTSILNRIATDQKVRKDIQLLTKLTYLSLVIGLFEVIISLLKVLGI